MASGGAPAQITINEGLAWLKTLKKRHEELVALRNDNAHRERRFYTASADREIGTCVRRDRRFPLIV